MVKACRISVLIVAICSTHLIAQDSDKNTYELLLLEIELYGSYQNFPDDTNALIQVASDYEKQGEYDFAIVYLQEALNDIKKPVSNETLQGRSDQQNLQFSILSGIDYNRQEFELGFEQNDSTLLDELSKPFVGYKLEYSSDNEQFSIDNSMRYDSENFQSDLFFNNKFINDNNILETQYGGRVDRSYQYDDLGYYELFTNIDWKSSYESANWYWSIKNRSRYKSYKKSSVTIPDFFRNSLTAYLIRNFNFDENIQLDYMLDYNESIKYSNNDFVEHNVGVTYQDLFFNKLKIKSSARYRYYDFNYQLSDSAFTNVSHTITLNSEFIFEIKSYLDLEFKYNIDIKDFKLKTEQEPDYIYNYINPGIVIKPGDLTAINLGYIYETRKHKTQNGLIEQYIKDQDYNSSGLSAGFDYSSLNGLLVSLSVEYTRRRYPNYNSDADFSIYSNRNIFSILFYAQIPVHKNIMLNAIGSYDNDKDIDSDFNNTISSFYTLELSYSF